MDGIINDYRSFVSLFVAGNVAKCYQVFYFIECAVIHSFIFPQIVEVLVLAMLVTVIYYCECKIITHSRIVG